MGASASISDSPEYRDLIVEATKPEDASDLDTLEDARAEVAKLRRALKAAAPLVSDPIATEIIIITGAKA